MKITSTMPLPLGEYDVITQSAAMRLIGQKAPATNDRHEKIGNAVVTDVDWRGPNEVLLTIEMEVESGSSAETGT